MALSYLMPARWPTDRTHSRDNVSPFADPRNPQFGIVSGSHRGAGSDPPMRGTAAELRERNAGRMRRPSLRGSFHRTASAPPATPLEIPEASAPPLPAPTEAPPEPQATSLTIAIPSAERDR